MMIFKNKWIRFFSVILVMAGFILSSGLWVAFAIQHRLKLEVHGSYLPVPFFPAFYLRDANFSWKGKVTLVSGNLKVHYSPVALLLGRVRTQISGKDLRIRLEGDWAQMQQVESVTLKKFEADLEIGPEGVREIYLLDAYSPEFQFRIHQNKK